MSGPSLSFFLHLLYTQLFVSLPKPSPSTDTTFQGRTIIVTGSNIGLGLEAARHFTALGAGKVILAVRNAEKGQAAKTSIEESTNTKGQGIVEVWPLELSNYASVKAFAARASSELERLDILLENAGMATANYNVAEDNEATITVNVISTFLLALLLLPKLRETAREFPTDDPKKKPHLVIVSSGVHYFTSFPEQSAPEGQILATLNDKTSANMEDRYNVSKLLEVFFTRELALRSPFPRDPAKKGDEGDVIINFLNPGLCHSELGREINTWGFWMLKLLLARSTEVGSRTFVHAAGAGQESHGAYLTECQVGQVAPLVSKDQREGGGRLQRRVWDEVAQKLEGIQKGILENV